MKAFCFSLATALAGIAFAATASADRVAMHENFEGGKIGLTQKGWKLPASASFSTEGSEKMRSSMIVVSQGQSSFATFVLPVEPGKTYYGSVMTRYETEANSIFYFEFADKDKKWVAGGTFPKIFTGTQKAWKELLMPPTTIPSDIRYLTVYVGLTGAGTASFADLEVKEFAGDISCGVPKDGALISSPQPTFTWSSTLTLPAMVQVSQDKSFPEDSTFTILQSEAKDSVDCDFALSPGEWHWKVVMFYGKSGMSESPVSSFTVDVSQPCRILPLWRNEASEDGCPELKLKVYPPQDLSGMSVAIDGVKAKIAGKGKDSLSFRPSASLAQGMHEVKVSFKGKDEEFIYCNKKQGESVSFRKDGVMLVGGAPFFPLGAYRDPSDSLDDFSGLLEAGFNLTHSYSFEDGSCLDVKVAKKYLEAAGKNGLKVFMGINRSKIMSLDKKWIMNFCGELRDENALLLWYLYDEPTSSRVFPPLCSESYKAIKAIDRNHPVAIVDYCIHAGKIQDFVFKKAIDFFWIDDYPIRGESFDAAAYENGMRRAIVVGAGKPFWIVLQAHDLDVWDGKTKTPRQPTPVQSRLMAHLALSTGATGLIWYWAPRKMYDIRKDAPETWKGVSDTVKEMKKLTPFLIGNRETYALALPVGFRCWSAAANGKRVLSIMNVRNEEAALRFSPGVSRMARFADCVEVSMDNGVAAEKFGPLEVKVYCWDEK